MPICRTCEGAYEQGMKVCPRCGADLVAWERVPVGLRGFFSEAPSRLGALFPIALALVSLPATTWVLDSAKWGVAAWVLICAFSALTFLGVYAARYGIRLLRWRGAVTGRSVASFLTVGGAVVAGVGGVLCGVLTFVLREYWLGAEGVLGFWERLALSATMLGLFVGLTAMASIFAVIHFVGWLNRRVPPPLFADEGRLMDVVWRAIRKRIGGGKFQEMGVVRLPDAGVRLVFRQVISVREEKIEEKVRYVQEERLWKVEADAWGRLRELKEAERQVRLVTE